MAAILDNLNKLFVVLIKSEEYLKVQFKSMLLIVIKNK